jgi:hypothetical protein
MKSFSITTIIVSIVLTLLLFSNSVLSEEIPYQKKLQICEKISNTGATYMQGRQVGVPMSQFMNSQLHESIKPLMHRIIIMAYEKPRYNTDSVINETIEDFKNEVYLYCIKSMTQ